MTDSQSVADVAEAGAASKRRGRPSEDARKARKQQLLATARQLFLERGFAQTPVSAIVNAAGVAQGTFYLYFANKQAVLGHLRAEVLADYMHSFEQDPSPVRGRRVDERLVSAMTRVRDAVTRQKSMTRVLRQASNSAEIDAIWIEGRSKLARPLAALLEEGKRDGSWPLDDGILRALRVQETRVSEILRAHQAELESE
jgi:AcrR family transcriptional regulator